MSTEPARLNLFGFQGVTERPEAMAEDGAAASFRISDAPAPQKLDPVSLAVWILFFTALVGFWLVAGWWIAGYLS